MSKSAPTWSVVATADEPPALVQCFVAWHLHLGAAHVYVYLDDPDDPVGGQFGHLPQVTVVRCDTAHWLRLGKSRPHRHEVRQVRNARDAYARAQTDWLLHCDADEFLYPHGAFGATLGAVSPRADGLIVPVAERVHMKGDAGATIFEGAFRRPFRGRPAQGAAIFGPDFDLTSCGLTGHVQGKCIVRTRRALNMSIHRPGPACGDQELCLERADSRDVDLLHFDGLTPAFWAYKLTRMLQALAERDGMPPSPHRRKQAIALMANPDRAAGLYARLKCPDDPGLAQLLERGLLLRPDFDPSGAVARFFPDTPIDITPGAIDAWLGERKPALLSYLDT